MIRAVFFDAGNTLIHPYPGVAEVCTEVFSHAAYSRASVDLTDVERALSEAELYYQERYRADDSFWASEPSAEDFWIDYYVRVAELVGLDGAKKSAAKAVYDQFGDGRRWRSYPDVPNALAALKERGLILGVISNWDTRLPEILFALGLDRAFDFVVSSARVGLIKPQPEIFELALARAGVRSDEAIHVGDHFYADILGAQSAGIKPVLIDRDGERIPGCASVSDLSQLLAFV